MRKLRWVPLNLLVLFAIEFSIFWWVGTQITFGWALLLIILLSLTGAYLLKREGARAWRRIRAASRSTTPPGVEVLDGTIGLVAALLLLIPGFLTAVAGLLLLIPAVRRAARGGARRLTERRVNPRVAGDLFGPRQVKVHRGPTRHDTSGAGYGPVTADAPPLRPGPADVSGRDRSDTGRGPAGGPTPGQPGGAGEVIEGEIVD